jgi:hypothetical protein
MLDYGRVGGSGMGKLPGGVVWKGKLSLRRIVRVRTGRSMVGLKMLCITRVRWLFKSIIGMWL